MEVSTSSSPMFIHSPFARLSCPLASSFVAVVTTSISRSRQQTHYSTACSWKASILVSLSLPNCRSQRKKSRRSGIWNLRKLFSRKKKSEKSGWDDPGQSDHIALQLPRKKQLELLWGRTSRANWNLLTTDPNGKSFYSEAELCGSGFGETNTRKSCFNEVDARKSGGIEGASETGNLDGIRLHRRVFSLKESDYFGGIEAWKGLVREGGVVVFKRKETKERGTLEQLTRFW